MSIWKQLAPTLLTNLAGYFANGLASRAMDWGNKLAQLPMIVKKGTTGTPSGIDVATAKLIGIDDGDWTRRELRRFRKSMGMSKLDFRNWKAQQMGLDPSLDYSRRDIRAAERSYGFYNPEINLTVLEPSSIFKTPGEMYLEYTQERFGLQPLPYMLAPNLISLKNVLQIHQDYVLGRFGLQPLPYMQLPLQPITPETPLIPITYNFGNNMNKYWANQAQKVLSNLTPEELYKISGNDGEISYDDVIAWQQGIGAGNDGKFGSGTIGAMNTKYGLNAMTDFKNPTKKTNNRTGNFTSGAWASQDFTDENKKGNTLTEQIVLNATLPTISLLSRTGNMLGNLVMSLR